VIVAKYCIVLGLLFIELDEKKCHLVLTKYSVNCLIGVIKV
jgi:hypothetical protein